MNEKSEQAPITRHEKQEDGPKQPLGYNETDRTRQEPDPQLDNIPKQRFPDGRPDADERSSEGEPGRAAADSTGGQVMDGQARETGT